MSLLEGDSPLSFPLRASVGSSTLPTMEKRSKDRLPGKFFLRRRNSLFVGPEAVATAKLDYSQDYGAVSWDSQELLDEPKNRP